MNKELKNALQKHYKLCYCYGCKNNPEKCHCAFKSFYDGGELGSTGAESKWRQTGWSRKDQTKLKANNYVAPKTYALAA